MGNSLMIQWLGFQPFTTGGPSSIPGQGTKILQAKKKKVEQIKLEYA